MRSRQKRMERFEREMRLKAHSNTLSTELPTMRALSSVQKAEGKAYIQLTTTEKNE